MSVPLPVALPLGPSTGVDIDRNDSAAMSRRMEGNAARPKSQQGEPTGRPAEPGSWVWGEHDDRPAGKRWFGRTSLPGPGRSGAAWSARTTS